MSAEVEARAPTRRLSPRGAARDRVAHLARDGGAVVIAEVERLLAKRAHRLGGHRDAAQQETASRFSRVMAAFS